MKELKYVFISHSNLPPEKQITARLMQYLVDKKLGVWCDLTADDDGLREGDWPAQLSIKIHGATIYILVAGENSLTSPQVQREIELMCLEADKNGKKIVPFVVDDYYFNLEPGTVDYFFGGNSKQAVILSKYPDEESAFEKVAGYMNHWLEAYVNDINDFALSADFKILKKYTGRDAIVKIPATVEEICDDAFASNHTLEKVVIPPSVKIIGKRAFFGCDSLVSVDGMEGVQNCELSAFERCGLKIAERGNYVLNGVAFGGAPANGVLTVPAGVKTIANRAFACGDFTEIILPDSLEHIGVRAFVDNYGVKEITFPPDLKTIGVNAFTGCDDLVNVVFKGSVPEGARQAFDKDIEIRSE